MVILRTKSVKYDQKSQQNQIVLKHISCRNFWVFPVQVRTDSQLLLPSQFHNNDLVENISQHYLWVSGIEISGISQLQIPDLLHKRQLSSVIHMKRDA